MKLLLKSVLWAEHRLLGACSTPPTQWPRQNRAQDERTVGYFSEAVSPTDKIANASSAELLGTTRKQHWVCKITASMARKPRPFTVLTNVLV